MFTYVEKPKENNDPSERIGQICLLLFYIAKKVSDYPSIEEITAAAKDSGDEIAKELSILYGTVRSKHIAQIKENKNKIPTPVFLNLVQMWLWGFPDELKQTLYDNLCDETKSADVTIIDQTLSLCRKRLEKVKKSA